MIHLCALHMIKMSMSFIWPRISLKIAYRPCSVHITHNWASEASPTLGCSIEISRDIYMYVGRYVCLSWSKKRRRKYVGQTRACSKSVLCGKIRPVTPVLFISTIRYSSFSMDGRETFT